MPTPAFVEHCIELLNPLGSVRAQRMFGGWGLYIDGLFVALIASERLFLKVDAASREQFAAAGCEPFVYGKGDKPVSMGYWTAPADALDSPALMQPWARLAVQAALSARALKPDAAARRQAAPKARTRTTATRPAKKSRAG